MCELLGLSFNKPVDIQISFTGFREHGSVHKDGWGLASYNDKKAMVVKEPAQANWSEKTREIANDPSYSSEIYIGHVRYMSRGERVMEDTHPFKQTLNDKDFVFAHNGTLGGYKSILTLESFFPIGRTDSEHAFCYILDMIKKLKLDLSNPQSYKKLYEILYTVNLTGRFNCLFSDGQRLFAYADANGYNGLRFTHRKPPFHHVRLYDKDWNLDLSYIKDPTENGYVIATKRLTDEPWERMSNGELIVFEKGRMIWSNMREVWVRKLRIILIKALKKILIN